MLKRKETAGNFRVPTREEYANVIPIVDTRYTDRGMEEKALSALEAKTIKQVERAVDRFLSSPEIEDLGKFNDHILRAYLKLPARIRETQQGKIFFDKIRRKANEIMAERKRSIDRVNENPYVVQLLDSSVEEMGGNLLTLESSVMQLARFVSSQAQTHPDRVFATGVNIDVRYGVDLVGADVKFDQGTSKLIVDLTLYQAKASRAGLPAHEVRDLPKKYAGQTRAVQEELEFDAEWVQKELLDRRPESGIDIGEEEVFDIVAGELTELASIQEKISGLSAQDRFLAEFRLYRLLMTAVDEFGGDLPAGVKKPEIVIGDIEFRYLVDSTSGTQDLSVAEAEQFGLRATG
ncbi:hypothetical protein COV05_03650 [Candidatus Uhrbacteria bacterium CG10_big_fil_rev_8_21_14_0_10_48_16]|uniref:Uncharacterized protein n=1 Tax=Candidatus Uhrbacteria bacterium CG10_big_fil_rev_8_21_14_0_10_48_16 TaxID=1975038 RepID=A0A2M8LGS2_9BACT|nr:MAG: hypothetical protein COV05_03650 [Candidatus Uhrbacteria bacterium CG10_big_fil_rev_8_21_14_0_10_48_16]